MRIEELAPGETARAFDAMQALRPDLAGEAEFARRVDERQREQGYRVVAAVEEDATVSAVAGFHVRDTLGSGRMLYVDDLSTLPSVRRRGLARALLDWCAQEAVRLGCDELHLDSAVGAQRQDAHRLYLNAGMRISSHRFSREL
jgi:GNAT superfamily N-acetyltransferase